MKTSSWTKLVTQYLYARSIVVDSLYVKGRKLPPFSATDQQVLYYDETDDMMKGATDMLWQYDPVPTDGKHLTIGLNNASKAYLLMNEGALPFPNFGGADGSIKFNNGDLYCMKAGTWTSLTQVGTAANAAGPQNSIQFNNINNQFGGDATLLWNNVTQTVTVGTPSATHGVAIVGTPAANIKLADGAGNSALDLVGGANPRLIMNNSGAIVTVEGTGVATFQSTGGQSVQINATNVGGSLVKSQLFQTYDPNIATGLQISSVVGGGGVNTITQILDFHTGQGFSFNYPLGPNCGMQLKANNMQFMQSGSAGAGSGFQFIFDNDNHQLGDSVFRIVSGVTGQSYSNNSVFRCDGNGSLIWAGVVGNSIIPQLNNTFTLGANPSSAWSSITVNKVNSGGALNPGGVAPNILVLNSLKIMPEYGFDNGGNGQDIGEPSAVGGSGAGGFRQIYGRNFIAGANGNASGAFQALAQAGTSSATLSASGPDLNLSNSVQLKAAILSTNSNVIPGGTNPALVFTNSSVGTVHNMILYGNNNVTGGDRDKILNIGYDSTLTNSPINNTSGYQMQFTLGGAGAGKLHVAGAGTFTNTLEGNTLTDGTAQITGGVGSGFTSVTSTTLTDGAGASLNGGTVTGSTVTDGTLSATAGSITGGINATFSGTLSLTRPGFSQNVININGGSGQLLMNNVENPLSIGGSLLGNSGPPVITGGTTVFVGPTRYPGLIIGPGGGVFGINQVVNDHICTTPWTSGDPSSPFGGAMYLGWNTENYWSNVTLRGRAISGGGHAMLVVKESLVVSGKIIRMDYSANQEDGVIIGASPSTNHIVNGDIHINGNLSKTAGSFKIDHPDPEKTETHTLWHSFVESPTAGDNLYRHRVTTKNKKATIKLPDYFKFLNVDEMTWVSPVRSFGRGYAVVNQEQTEVEVVTDEDGDYNVLIIGTRKDKDAVKNWKGVERLK